MVEFAAAEYVFAEGAFGAEFIKPFGDAGVDDSIEPPPSFWPVTVADCVDKQVFEGTAVEGVGVAEHVEEVAVIGFGHSVDFFEQPVKHIAFASVAGNQVPEVADLALTDTVNATESLFDAIGVPGQIIVDHEVGTLQVEPLASSVGGEQHEGARVVRELFADGLAKMPRRAPMNGNNSVGAAQLGADFILQVGEGIAVFGEDNDLAVFPIRAGQHLAFQDFAQLHPLPILVLVAHPPGRRNEPVQHGDFVRELHLVLGCGRAIHHLVDLMFQLRPIGFRHGAVVVIGGIVFSLASSQFCFTTL